MPALPHTRQTFPLRLHRASGRVYCAVVLEEANIDSNQLHRSQAHCCARSMQGSVVHPQDTDSIDQCRLHQDNEETTIYEDNKQVIAIVKKGKYTELTKHIDVKYMSMHEWNDNELQFVDVATTNMVADPLTKPVARPILHRCWSKYLHAL
eukprot:m.21531 g.21531  ORF g.21531 m.21531 type:complete len:151 (+) comp8296_c0_seq1:353-805(+)